MYANRHSLSHHKKVCKGKNYSCDQCGEKLTKPDAIVRHKLYSCKAQDVFEIPIEDQEPEWEMGHGPHFRLDIGFYWPVESLREVMLKNNQHYTRELDLGKRIESIVREENIREESLSIEHRNVLNLYRKQNKKRRCYDCGKQLSNYYSLWRHKKKACKGN